MERRMEHINLNPDVAADDQQRARARDLLLEADEFVLLVPAEEEGLRAVRCVIDASIDFMTRGACTLAHAIIDGQAVLEEHAEEKAA